MIPRYGNGRTFVVLLLISLVALSNEEGGVSNMVLRPTQGLGFGRRFLASVGGQTVVIDGFVQAH